ALHGSSFSECIRGIKEQLRSIPNHGIGYGILKWIRSRNSHIVVPKKSEVRFNYLGEFTNDFVNDLFSYTTETTGYDTDPRNHMTSKLELNCMLLHGALRLDVNYNSRLFTPSTIDTFCAIFKDYAHQMREHLMSENDIHFTP